MRTPLEEAAEIVAAAFEREPDPGLELIERACLYAAFVELLVGLPEAEQLAALADATQR